MSPPLFPHITLWFFLWYGSSTNPKVDKFLQNTANRLNWKDRRHSFKLERVRFYPAINYTFQIPLSWDLVVLKSLTTRYAGPTFYLYNGTYFINFVLTLTNTQFTYDRQTNSLVFQKFDSCATYFSLIKSFTELFLKFDRPFFLKIKFKGKGYYLYKNSRNTIAPQFGYAHRVYIYSFANSVKFLSKTKVFLFGLSKKDILKTGYTLFQTRPINVFTGRGVRFARQVIYKKTGKVGAYR